MDLQKNVSAYGGERKRRTVETWMEEPFERVETGNNTSLPSQSGIPSPLPRWRVTCQSACWMRVHRAHLELPGTQHWPPEDADGAARGAMVG